MPTRSLPFAHRRTPHARTTHATRTGRLPAPKPVLLAPLWLALVLCAGDALAFAPDTPSGARESVVRAPAATDFEAVLDRAAPSQDHGARETWMERVSRRLRRIPLRPVTIGDAPRTPDDPEPGAGLTIYLQF